MDSELLALACDKLSVAEARVVIWRKLDGETEFRDEYSALCRWVAAAHGY